MAGPWEKYQQITIPGSLANESSLSGLGAIDPEAQADQDAFDQTDYNQSMLTQEIARQMKNPATPDAVSQLQAEQARIASQPSIPTQTEAKPWEKYGKPWEKYSKDKSPLDMLNIGTGQQLDETGFLGPLKRGLNKIDTSVSEFQKQLIENPKDVAVGALGGLAGGLIQGATWLNAATPGGMAQNIVTGQGTPSAIMEQSQKNVKTFNDFLPTTIKDKLENSMGSKAAQEVLSLPFMPFEKVSDMLKEAGHPQLADAFMGTVMGAGTLLMFKGAGGKKAAVESPKIADPNTKAGAAVNDLVSKKNEAPLESDLNQALKEQEATNAQYEARPYEQVKITPEESAPYQYEGAIQREQGDAYTAQARTMADKPYQYNDYINMDERPSVTDQQGVQMKGMVENALEKEPSAAPNPLDASLEQNRQSSLFDQGNVERTVRDQQIEEAYRQREAQQLAERQAEPIRDRSLDEINPSQGSRQIEKIQPPITNRAGLKIAKSQRGQADMINDLAKKIYDLAQGTSRLVREGPFKEGDTVRLMNGKVAIIQKVTSDERGNPRYQVKNKDGSFDSIPRQGINYAYKPAGIVENPVGYTSQINKPLGGVGKKGFGQGGSFDIKSFLRDQNLNKETDGTPKDLLMRTSSEFQNEMINQNHWKHEIGAITKVPKNHKLYGGMPYRITEHNWLSLRGEYQYRGDVLNPDGSIKRVGLPIKQHYLEKSLGQTQIGKNQMGAIDLRALFGKDKPTIKEVAPSDTGVYKDLIRKILSVASDREMFETLMRTTTDEPDILGNLDHLWASREDIINSKEPSAYSQLDSQTRRQSSDIFRTMDQMISEEGLRDGDGRIKPLQKDISMGARFYNPAHIMKQVWWDTPTGKVSNWVISNIQEIANQESQIFKQSDHFFDKFRELPNKQKQGVMRAAMEFDGASNDVLREQGLQWPTRDMLKEKGLSDIQIDAYEDITRSVDNNWKTLQQIFRQRGLEPPERIPGYFPHMWAGSYRVFVYRGNSPVALYTFATRWGRDAFIKEANKTDKFGQLKPEEGTLSLQSVDPKADPSSSDMVSSILQVMDGLKGKRGLDFATQALLKKISENATRGIYTELLERKANLAGHMAEQGYKGFKDSMFDPMHNTRITSAYIKLNEDIAKAWANERIVNEVLKPLEKNSKLFEDTPHLKAYFQELIGRATGHDTQHFKIIDEMLRQAAISLGVSPNIVGNIAGGLTSSLYMAKLTLSPLYWLANAVQPLIPMGDLARIHADRVARGLPAGNPAKAYAMISKEWANIREGHASPEVERWAKWAEKNDVADTIQADQINPATGLSAWSAFTEGKLRFGLDTIERHNRLAAFLGLMSYFKDIMPERVALEAAKNNTNIIMGNYSRVNSPGMFTNFGMLGNLAKPFQTLHNMYMGKLMIQAMQIKTGLLEAEKQGMSRSQAVKLVAPAAVALAGLYYMSGIIGLPGAREYDAVVRMLNNLLPELDLRTIQEMLAEHRFDNSSIYGTLSTMLDVNVGTTFNSPAFTESGGMPAIGAAVAIGRLVFNAIKSAKDPDNVNWTQVFNDISAISPPQIKYFIEKKLGEKTKERFDQDHRTGVVVPSLTNGKGTVERSERDQTLGILFGRRSVTEQKERDTNASARYRQKVDEQYRQDSIQKLTNNFLSIGYHKKTFEEMLNDIVAEGRGQDPSELKRAVINGVKDRLSTDRERLVRNLANSKGEALRRKMEILKSLGIELEGQ